MSTPSPNPTALSLPDLRAEVRGEVIGPDDAGYDAARVVANGAVDGRPAVIVRAADADDVARVVALARETGLELAVRSGGHSGAGHSTCDGGIVLDLRAMRALELDPGSRTGWVEAGLTAGEFTTAAAEHGLAVGFGDTGSVGLGGLTLGGGVGYLARKHGLTIDSLLAAEIVTADGQLRRVDEASDPDLFWALRGGGGNFGVATRFHFRLHPVGQIVGGMLVLPATADTVAGFVAASEAAPVELTTIGNVMNCPPLPFVAEEHHGSLVIFAVLCFAGDVADGDEVMRPFRELAEPLADMVRPMPYPEIYPPEDPGYRPTAVARTMFVDRIDRAAAETVVDRLGSSDAVLRAVQLRALGGAVSDVAPDATAYAHRASRIMVNVAAFYDGAEDRARRQAWVDELSAALQQDDTGAYVNFLADEGEDRIRAAYPKATWDRLAEVKARLDPENVFRRNQNIPPAG
jgi:FAD/FMN-containing dehydrogenase